jgi:hypothetical protein
MRRRGQAVREQRIEMQLRFTVPAATVALVLAASVIARGQAPDGSPRIVECRVGLASCYKVGYWTPVWAVSEGAADLRDPRIEVATVDSDGVETIVSAEVGEISSGGQVATLLYAKIGRVNAPIRVSLRADGVVIDRKQFDPLASTEGAPVLDVLPATSELIVSLGGGSSGLADAIGDRDRGVQELARRVVEINGVAGLPDEWFGYEAVDLLVLSGDDVKLCRALAADEERLTALRRWVELGGRLVIVCGGKAAEELFAEGQPLSAFLPGRLEETVELDVAEATPLEHFAEATEPIIGRRGPRIEISVPKLGGVRGNIEAYAGERPTDLPLVIRAALGLGEVAFAGVALAEPPLAEWTGRGALWRALAGPYLAEEDVGDGPQTLSTLGYNDLSGALRQRLGRSFAGVTTVTFPLVALFVIVYLALLGPAHYWLVHHYGGRPALAWVVFPLLVVATSGAAHWLGQRSKGDAPRVNQTELVDVDLTTGTARGTYWAALYSPESRRFDVTLGVDQLAAQESAVAAEAPSATAAETLLSWWGLPGGGVGGMQAGSVSLATIDTGYRFSPALDALVGVPILTSSTKALLARWTAPVGAIIGAELADDDGLVVGTLTNETGRTLENSRLMYGTWAYRLDDLQPGQRVEIGEHLTLITVGTLVTRNARTETRGSAADRDIFLAERASTDELLTAMMFYEAAGGDDFAQLPNRSQSYCDLSRLLELGRAILVAELAGDGSELIDRSSGEPLGGEAGAAQSRICRFILPVDK